MYVEMADIRNDPVLFGNKDWASGRNQGIIISPRGVEKDIKLNIGDGSNRFDATFPYPNNFLEGWTHLLFTFDRQENIICFYTNFELIGTCSISEELKNLSLDSAFPYYVGNDSTEKYGYGRNHTKICRERQIRPASYRGGKTGGRKDAQRSGRGRAENRRFYRRCCLKRNGDGYGYCFRF